MTTSLRETPKETMERQAWHLLAQQMTHAINCKDPDHKISCEDFTDQSHAELMAHIETYVDERLKEYEEMKV